MAAFATLLEAETRATAKVADGTWLNAHAGVSNMTNTFCVRVQRKMSPTNPDYGAWIEITDDATD